MLGGLGMFKKIITGTLVLIVLTTSGIAYAGPLDEMNIDGQQLDIKSEAVDMKISKVKKEDIQIISPQISSEKKEVVADKSLTISINVLGETSVTLSFYKVSKVMKVNEETNESEKTEEVTELFTQVVEPNEELETDFSKYIKDIEQGNYRMIFKEDGIEKPIDTIEFTVKKTEEVVNKENLNTLPNLLDLNITDLLPGE
jgi:hypothetical protein